MGGAFKRRIRFAARELVEAGRNFYHDHGFDLAAALSFWTILNAIPFLLIFAALFGFLVDAVGGPNREVLLEQVAGALHQAFPGLDPSIISYLEKLVAERATLSAAAIPLLLTSSALYSTLENGLVTIFEPERSRSAAHSKLLLLAFLTALLVGLIALALAWWALTALGGLEAGLVGFLLQNPVGASILAILVCAGIFMVLLRWFSVKKLPLRMLVAGGLLFGVLWTIARLLFSLYLRTLASYSLVYGSFATLVVVLFWTYYSASIFVYAAEWVHVLCLRGKVGAPTCGG